MGKNQERFSHLAHLTDETVTEPHHEGRVFGREAVRAVLSDERGRIALLYISEHNIYKLPGGGVKVEEELHDALSREIAEETGCEISDFIKLGVITEDRESSNFFQISHCYLVYAKTTTEPSFTQDEIKDGFQLFWVNSIEEALAFIDQNTSAKVDDVYIKTRDRIILLSVMNYFAQS